MRTILTMFVVALTGCVVDETAFLNVQPPTPVIDIPGFYWSYDKHKNITTLKTPRVKDGYARYRFLVLYTHENGLQSREVSPSPIILVVQGPGRYLRSAYSYGEEFPVLNGGVVVPRYKLHEYANKPEGWRLQVVIGIVDHEIHIPASYIRRFLEITPECEASSSECFLERV